MNDWFDKVNGVQFNVLRKDFNLYSTYEDAKADNYPWTECNYNDHGIGFPRDCGPNGYVAGQWTAYNGHTPYPTNAGATQRITDFVRNLKKIVTRTITYFT